MKIDRIAKNAIKSFLLYNRQFQDYRFKKIRGAVDSDTRIVYYKGNKTKQIGEMLDSISLNLQDDARFQHWIDENLVLFGKSLAFFEYRVIGNTAPDYTKIIKCSIEDLKQQNAGDNQVQKNNVELLTYIESYIDKIIEALEKKQTNPNIQKNIHNFLSMKKDKAQSLEDALQRILFWSSLFWQSGHKLIGLGRLDKLLEDYAEIDDQEYCIAVLKDFLLVLHNYYDFKSAALLGDIGQIIILGGLEEDGTYYCNNMTYCFLEAIKEIQVTDPKILLRVSHKMPLRLMECAVDCVSKGTGSPLFSNDDIIIPALQKFGYEVQDAYNYTTSACWEPVSYGNSLEQNNLTDINFADALIQTLCSDEILKITEYDQFIQAYIQELKNLVKGRLEFISGLKWEEDPLFTFFVDECGEKNLDISEGGAKYNNYGILSVGMANAVDSIINIRKIVFENHEMTLGEIHQLWTCIDKDTEKIAILTERLKKMSHSFGHDDVKVVDLVNCILKAVSEETCAYRNKYNGKVKFGLSSPNYVHVGKSTGCTFDGRQENDPLSVHISAAGGVAFTELISFASQIEYEGWNANGNVVDFFVTPEFIENNKEKFVDLLFLGIKQGFFQMQMNVVSSDMLIAAKNNPEKFPNLIVRVWGFSAYFVDLPVEYKDVLIRRALLSEGKAS